MSILYTAQAHATGGRIGTIMAEDGNLSVKLTSPKQLGGDGAPGTNPEQLFAAGYAACFIGAMRYVARKEKIVLPLDTNVNGAVGIGLLDSGEGFYIDVDLTIAIPGFDRASAEELVRKAHIVCPYSHATRGNIDVRLHLV